MDSYHFLSQCVKETECPVNGDVFYWLMVSEGGNRSILSALLAVSSIKDLTLDMGQVGKDLVSLYGTKVLVCYKQVK